MTAAELILCGAGIVALVCIASDTMRIASALSRIASALEKMNDD